MTLSSGSGQPSYPTKTEQLFTSQQQVGDAMVAKLVGPADLRNIETLTSLCTRLSAARPLLTVLDLSEMSAIGSLGLGQLVALHQTLKNYGLRLILAAPTPRVSDVLKHARLDTFFSISASVDEALTASRGPGV